MSKAIIALDRISSAGLEHLTGEELEARAIADRKQRAPEERMTVRATDPERPWSDYLVTSERSAGGEPDQQIVQQLTKRLEESTTKDEQGRSQLTITLADDEALRGLATTLAKLLQAK